MKIAKRLPSWLERWRQRLREPKRASPRTGVPALAAIEPVEGKVQSALRPVEPPQGFRETLRENLRVAAQQHQTGMRVEHLAPVRQLVLLTVSLGVVVATITSVLLRHRD